MMYTNIPLPLRYKRTYSEGAGINWTKVEPLYPISVSIDLSLVPLSTARIVLPLKDELNFGDYVRLFTMSGEAGLFRVTGCEYIFENSTAEYELEHAVSEVGDWIVTAKYDTKVTVRTAINRLFNGESGASANYLGDLWELGDVSALPNDIYVELSVDRDDVLSSMLEVLEAVPDVWMEFEYPDRRNFPTPAKWKINFVKDDGETWAESETVGRLGQNIASASVTYDFTDLCTRVHYDFDDTWRSYTAPDEYIQKYGQVRRSISTSGESSLDRAKYVAQEYLRMNQEPKVHIEIGGEDLMKISGSTADELILGKPYRFYIPEKDITIQRRITALSWGDVYGDPANVNVTLGDDDPSLWAFMNEKRRKLKKK